MKEVNIVFLLDETGSMNSILNDTIGGFNSFIRQQKDIKEARMKFTLILFNSGKIEKRYIDVDINEVAELSTHNYIPNNGTPLWDAIGKTINELASGGLGSNINNNVLFVIYTDGEENSSQEYTVEAIKKMIEEQQKAGWEFLYLGVDITKFDDAINIGINKHFTVNKVNTRGAYASLGETVLNYVSTGKAEYTVPEDKQDSN